MKRISVFIVVFILSFIGINKVQALDEYTIEISIDNDVKLYKMEANAKNEITDEDTKNSIYSFVDNDNNLTLTLKENVHYYAIQSNPYNKVKITSNDKQVYLNLLYGTWCNLDHLKATTYTPVSTYKHDYMDVGEITHFHFGELEINDSNINLIYEPEDESIQNQIHTVESDPQYGDYGHIKIKNSTVRTTSALIVPEGKSITIDGSNVYAYGLQVNSNDPTKTNLISIKNSYVETLSNETMVFMGGVYGSMITSMTKVTIDSSEVRTNGTIQAKTLEIKNSTVGYKDGYEKFYFTAINGQEVTFQNADIRFKGNVIIDNLVMENSYLQVETGANSIVLAKTKQTGGQGFDYATATPLIVNSINLTNSNIRAISNSSVPAVAITTSITSDKESFIWRDDNNKILEFKKVNVSDYPFKAIPDGYDTSYNATIIDSDEVYTIVDGDDAVTVASTDESETITLKILNGTWKDGTKEDKVITVVKGTIITKDYVETLSINADNVLVLTKTGNNEYTYQYVSQQRADEIEKEKNKAENPKTGVQSLILLLVCSLLGAIVLSINKDKFSLFRNL